MNLLKRQLPGGQISLNVFSCPTFPRPYHRLPLELEDMAATSKCMFQGIPYIEIRNL
jgi:hypothetical protein